MIKIIKNIKINLLGGKANPSPPIGPILGTTGINIMDFCKKFNLKTKNQYNELLPTKITIYNDKSFKFKIFITPVSKLLLKSINLKKGSKEPNKIKIGNILYKKIIEIAKFKLKDLNCYKNIKSATSMVIGTAKSLGINIIYEKKK
ncbi:MAG: 50S ribosomal protein L11 [Candidatus Shikimatogenerans sp. AspAUS03]|uniref:Large ribosomal subunit protein uL11 n=1 Tax=Candidatus Shikimatogenerans sp. AspAUS03 TaxID=3158563 RepID=A0AAU7QSP1_9FLAO